MPYFTPLRYPGGKRRLAPIVMRLLQANSLRDVHYVEPYAGGAAIALSLLFNEYASYIHINDLSRPVYAFWHSVIHTNKELCELIKTTDITLSEWEKQRSVFDRQNIADPLELGFATLFLNRTNRSGIISGGIIGGKKQTGLWKLDARFNKEELVRRIRRVGRYGNRIKLYQSDALTFIKETAAKLRNAFAFIDPPYIEKGEDLYLNNYNLMDHQRIALTIGSLQLPWIVTYDCAAVDHRLFPSNRRLLYELPYAAHRRYRAKEVMFFSDTLHLPESWVCDVPIPLASEGSEYPFYGRIASMKPHPKMEEGPTAARRFVKALKTVLSVPKQAVPNPFKPEQRKKKKPAVHKD